LAQFRHSPQFFEASLRESPAHAKGVRQLVWQNVHFLSLEEQMRSNER
jgi:hypothetical protein